jgi:hypothetical protein
MLRITLTRSPSSNHYPATVPLAMFVIQHLAAQAFETFSHYLLILPVVVLPSLITAI